MAAFIAPALVPLMPSMMRSCFFQQSVEHAPGICPVRAAALQGEIDGFHRWLLGFYIFFK